MKLQLTKLEKFVVESPDTFHMIAQQLNRTDGAVIRAYGRAKRKIWLQEKNINDKKLTWEVTDHD